MLFSKIVDLIEEANKPHIDNLVFEGGGALGLAHVGAIEILNERGMLKDVERFAGSSAGAIVAAALACGATPDYIKTQLSTLDIPALASFSYFAAPWNLYMKYGLNDGAKLLAWFRTMLTDLTGDADITFEQLFKSRDRHLIITGTSIRPINGACTHYFSHLTHPQMPICLALRISTCVPFLFQPVLYQDEYWVDGGLLNNYPIGVFHDDTGKIQPHTLGFLLTTRSEEMADAPKTTSFMKFAQNLMSCCFNLGQRTYIESEDWRATVKIDCARNSALKFDSVDKAGLIAAGRDAALAHFADKN